jgi:hypothetical protein
MTVLDKACEPSILDKFERIGVFRFTRLITLLSVFTTAMVLIVLATTFLTTLLPQYTSVGGEEVAAVLKAKTTPASGESRDDSSDETVLLSTVKPGPGVKKEFSDSTNRKVLAGWLKGLPKASRQDFIDNMEEVIAYAQRNSMNVTDAINTYKELKLDKVGTVGLDQLERKLSQGTIIGSFLFGLMLLALFSLVLVLLAIERNTRGEERVTGVAAVAS